MKKSEKDVVVTVKSYDRRDLGEKLGECHENPLPTKKVVVCLVALALGMVVSFADQQGITVGLTQVGHDLHALSTINWAGTASLLANTACQVLFGRLSDIFGRKTVLLCCLGILVVSDVACGLAQTGPQFFVFRAGAGIGNGGVLSLNMVILSDIVLLKNRGKYQGILGASVGIGNAIGPALFGAFVKSGNWRHFYFTLAPIGCLVFFVIWWFVDSKPASVILAKEKLAKIDYLGTVLSTTGLTMLLVGISSGGSELPWDSPLVVAMLSVGAFLLVMFVVCEWKVPELPMIPMWLFRSPSLSLVLSSNFFFGMVYYSFMYYLPYYFQIIKFRTPVQSAVFMLPLVLGQSVTSVLSGQIITYTGHYIYVVWFGYATWLLSCGLMLLWGINTSDAVNVVVLLLMGVGVGFTFQPTMVAAQAHARKADRAVVISTRNVLRSFGGAVGIAAGSSVVSNSFLREIDAYAATNAANLSAEYLAYLRRHIYASISVSGLGEAQVAAVQNMYLAALHKYYIMLIPLMGVCFVSSLFVRDRGLQCADEVELTASSASSRV